MEHLLCATRVVQKRDKEISSIEYKREQCSLILFEADSRGRLSLPSVGTVEQSGKGNVQFDPV